MYTVIGGVDVSEERFEELRPVMQDVTDDKDRKLKQGTLRIDSVDGGIISLNICYCGFRPKEG